MARRRDGLVFEPRGSLRVSQALTSSTDSHPVELRIVAPAVRTPAAGALLFLHGGGFVLGDVEDLAGPAGNAEHTGVVVVSVGYRLAPEPPYPGALHDSYAGLSGAHAHAAELGADSKRIGVGGISAGAGLAAALALLSRDRGGPAIAFQMLYIPGLDDPLAPPPMQPLTHPPLWTPPYPPPQRAAHPRPRPP